MLRNLDGKLFTGVAGQPIGHIFEEKAVH